MRVLIERGFVFMVYAMHQVQSSLYECYRLGVEKITLIEWIPMINNIYRNDTYFFENKHNVLLNKSINDNT